MWPERPGTFVPACGIWALTVEDGEPLVSFKYKAIGLSLCLGQSRGPRCSVETERR